MSAKVPFGYDELKQLQFKEEHEGLTALELRRFKYLRELVYAER